MEPKLEPPPAPADEEHQIIAALLTPSGAEEQHPLWVPPGDDAAVFPDGRAVTVDTLIEGLHFDHRLSPQDVGFKAIAVSVSDLAAMGARPEWAVLSLSVPGRDRWTEGFIEGLQQALRRWNIRLIGGDTTGTTGPRVVSLTLSGTCVAEPLQRSGGQPGDTLWVTGTLGLAGEGWSSHEPRPFALSALRRPAPPLAFALDLAQRGLCTSAMDLSDGLAKDLPRLCAASRVGAFVDLKRLPGGYPPREDTLQCQLHGGEDYQLLFTTADTHSVHSMASAHVIQVTAIGHLTEGQGIQWANGAFPPPLFDHFQRGEA